MTRRLILLLAGAAWALSPCRAAGVDEVLPLPQWTQEDAEMLYDQPENLPPLGGLLWPDGFDASTIQPPTPQLPGSPEAGDPLGALPPKNRRGIGENFLLFIPKPPAPQVQRALPAEKPLTEVTPEELGPTELSEPDAFLLDPHTLLPETQSEDLRRLLAFHVSQSHTSAYFLLLDSHEKLSPKVDLSGFAGGRLTKEHACLAAFPLGQPWRARLFVTREISTGVPAGYLPGLLEACVKDAMRASDPIEQLQRFATQLSIRLIWMERAYPALFSDGTAPSKTEAKAAPEPEDSYVLADVTMPDETEDEGLLSWKRVSRDYWRQGVLALSGLALLAAGVIGFFRWRARRQSRSMWILPEVESKPRFGGAHCGGGGAWIKYG